MLTHFATFNAAASYLRSLGFTKVDHDQYLSDDGLTLACVSWAGAFAYRVCYV